MAMWLKADYTKVEFLHWILGNGEHVLAGEAEVNGEAALLVVESKSVVVPECGDLVDVVLKRPMGEVYTFGRLMKRYEVRAISIAQVA